VPPRTPQEVPRYVTGHTSSNRTIHTLTQSKYILPPKSVIYFGCVGKDKYADILSDAAKKAGLEVRYRVDEEQPTGRCGVVVTGHDRSLVTDLAAATGTLSRRARHTSLVATTLLSAFPPSWLSPRRPPQRTRFVLLHGKALRQNTDHY
jgi:adenosine kinase